MGNTCFGNQAEEMKREAERKAEEAKSKLEEEKKEAKRKAEAAKKKAAEEAEKKAAEEAKKKAADEAKKKAEAEKKLKEAKECLKDDIYDPVNPVVLLTGGSYGNGDSVEVFSPWQAWQDGSYSKDLPELPYKAYAHTVNVFDGEVIICGGKGSCLSFNETLQRFVPYEELSNSEEWHLGAVYQGTLFLLGNNPNFVEEWDGSRLVNQEDIPTIYSEMKEFGDGSSIAASNTEGVFVVGKNLDGKLKMYRWKNGLWWRTCDPPTTMKSHHASALIQTPEGGALLIAGGLWSCDSSWLFNIEKNEWKEVGKLPAPREKGKIVVVDNRVILLGGSTIAPGTGVEEYNTKTEQWSRITQEITRGRINFSAVVISKDLIL